ncbi:surface antigen (D15) [Halothece sp. PCC 7418]|nr:surface antigen (D15) [Halothece sp. PCC 7418]
MIDCLGNVLGRKILMILLVGISNLVRIQPSFAESEAVSPVKLSSLEMDYSTQAKDLQHYSFFFIDESSPLMPIDSVDDPERDRLMIGQAGDLKVPLGEATGNLLFGFGSLTQEPTTVRSANRRRAALRGRDTLGNLAVDTYLGFKPSDDELTLLEIKPDLTGKLINFDLIYVNLGNSDDYWQVNLFNQRSRSPSFENGETAVDLPNGNVPWVDRVGVGLEYVRDFTPGWRTAFGINYQRIAVRDEIFSSDLQPFDERGNPLTLDDDGNDTMLLLGVSTLFSTIDEPSFPTEGSRLRFAIDQSIPVGDADLTFTRLEFSASQYFPLQIYQIGKLDPQVLILNIQAGTVMGDDLPPYEAFNLGGSSSVRGFAKGEVGSGKSFIQGSVELRLPLFTALKSNFGVNLFMDYADDLGTADQIVGNPADVRDKPGSGFGYGLGLYGDTPIGFTRFELGFTDEGSSQFHFLVFGDRF